MNYLAFILLSGLSLQTLAQGPTPALRNPATQTPLPPPPSAVDAADNQLSPEQKQKMKDLHLQLMKQALPLKNELREKEAHLQTLRTAANPDFNQISALMDEIGQLKTNLAKKREWMFLEFRKLLNEEQRILFDSNRKAFMKRARHHGKHPKQGKHGKPNRRGNNDVPMDELED